MLWYLRWPACHLLNRFNRQPKYHDDGTSNATIIEGIVGVQADQFLGLSIIWERNGSAIHSEVSLNSTHVDFDLLSVLKGSESQRNPLVSLELLAIWRQYIRSLKFFRYGETSNLQSTCPVGLLYNCANYRSFNCRRERWSRAAVIAPDVNPWQLLWKSLFKKLFHRNCHEAGHVDADLYRDLISVSPYHLSCGSARPLSELLAHLQLVVPVFVMPTYITYRRYAVHSTREKLFIEDANYLFCNVASACCMSKLADVKCMTCVNGIWCLVEVLLNIKYRGARKGHWDNKLQVKTQRTSRGHGDEHAVA